jgi:hypothetical protein
MEIYYAVVLFAILLHSAKGNSIRKTTKHISLTGYWGIFIMELKKTAGWESPANHIMV